jgi:hypothetical protein
MEENTIMQLTNLHASTLLSLLLLGFSTGCEDPGIVLEFHLPKEPTKQLHLEIVIDTESGRPAREVASGRFAIDFSESGVAVIDSPRVLRRWHKTFIVTPTRRLTMIDDFRQLDSGWKMARVREILPGGGVRSSSTEHGSKYWMDIEVTKPTAR